MQVGAKAPHRPEMSPQAGRTLRGRRCTCLRAAGAHYGGATWRRHCVRHHAASSVLYHRRVSTAWQGCMRATRQCMPLGCRRRNLAGGTAAVAPPFTKGQCLAVGAPSATGSKHYGCTKPICSPACTSCAWVWLHTPRGAAVALLAVGVLPNQQFLSDQGCVRDAGGQPNANAIVACTWRYATSASINSTPCLFVCLGTGGTRNAIQRPPLQLPPGVDAVASLVTHGLFFLDLEVLCQTLLMGVTAPHMHVPVALHPFCKKPMRAG